MTELVTGKVVRITHWTDILFTMIVHAPVDQFIAGQFAKLGLEINGELVQRAYSYVNAPMNHNLEFYLLRIPNGKLSQQLQKLQTGDRIMVSKKAAGFFVLNAIPTCENLWMLATGTAIGPYLSILEHGQGLERFPHIVLVHAVRFAHELRSYLPKLLELQQRYQGKLLVQTVVSREQIPGSLTGRLPALIASRALEAAVDLELKADNNHVMLCGNPQMVRDTQQLLIASRGMHKHLKRQSGQITSENYW